ncbi:hypothetical protein F2P45_05140 [Massilia sp. CCM 8733]|uniref:Uncharacterized protein n=1 Tax=Massilia mucilaginosa TaxID=2609282 RepID=A0ABX0NNN9_9BURK|nr:hypothetical protein [Massilia mucilaginosa]NHZ88412.1 hypothetical protein [Massilia mucilaginosa]
MNHEELQRVTALPEYLPAPQVEKELASLLRSFRHGMPDAQEKLLMMEALAQLADRQWQTFEILPHAARKRLSAFAIGVWERRSLASTALLISIIRTLGLSDALAFATSLDPQTLAPIIAAELHDALAEFGDTVDNPYTQIKQR